MGLRNKIVYILKHNLAIQRLYSLTMSIVFRIVGAFIKTDPDLVLFVSFMGKSFNDSPKAMFDYMKAHPEYLKYDCVWAFESPDKYPDLKSVKIDTFDYFKTALKAKYWVTNTNIERGLKFKKRGTVYLNTWHGIALKTIGNDCPGRKDYNFDTLDYLAISGEYDAKVFRSAFNAKEESYLRCGMPRNERLWNAVPEEKEEMRTKLGIPHDKKAILYAPTWRDSLDGGASYDFNPPIDFKNWRELLGEEYVVLFRHHVITTKVSGFTFDEFLRDVSSYPDVNDLMIAADILVTDYSAIAFDYSILCRPILCFAYDYDSYLASRGTYFDMDSSYPNKSCRTEKELLERIITLDYSAECKNTEIFRNQFVEYGQEATKVCVETLFGV